MRPPSQEQGHSTVYTSAKEGEMSTSTKEGEMFYVII